MEHQESCAPSLAGSQSLRTSPISLTLRMNLSIESVNMGMHFSGTQARMYVRKMKPFLKSQGDGLGNEIVLPNADWKSNSTRKYLTALDDPAILG